MMRKREISRSWLFIAMLTFSLAACAERTAPFGGVVLEKGTEQPIADAIVIARWKGTIDMMVDSATVCVHAMTTTTNEKGEYTFPEWEMESKERFRLESTPSITAYKKGYKVASGRHPPGIFYLALFKGNYRERLEHLGRLSGFCTEAGASQENLYPYLKAVYEEAKGIAQTTSDYEIVSQLRKRAASYALAGSDTEGADTIEEIKNRQEMIEEFMEENLP